MERKKWVRLDNASNIFLAAKNDVDTKVFRLSAELISEIDPPLLQQALNKVYDQYALYHSVLRRGIFWYYLEESNLQPVVRPETLPPCAPLYHFDRKELLFRVIYHHNRVHLEVFHALSDGTGALWFFEDLISEYVALKYLEQVDFEKNSEQKGKTSQLEDSFARYFRKRRQKNFAKAAFSAIEKIYMDREDVQHEDRLSNMTTMESVNDPSTQPSTQISTPIEKKRIYRIRGKRTPDNRMRVIELDLPLRKMLDLARQHNVSLTIYLIALYVSSIYQTREKLSENSAITISVPVNLRQYFPSRSARNFFTTTQLAVMFEEGKEVDFSDMCQKLAEQLKQQTSVKDLEQRLNRFISFEMNPFIRILFRPLKDFILKLINLLNNQKVTVAMSNLGRTHFPESVQSYVENMYFHTSAIRPQFCVISHKDHLTVSFTTPFVETDIQKRFVELLRDQGIPVTVGVNKVTREELEM